MALTLAQLRLVLAVHEHGSLGKACASLNLTQPALSRNLRELERYLGVPLFERHPSGLRATQFSLAILPYAANMVQAAAQVLEEVRILAGQSHRMLRIGAVSAITKTLVPALIERLVEDAPDTRVNVIEGVSDTLIDALKSHAVDIVLAGPIPQDDEIESALDLGLSDSCSALIGANHPLRGRAGLTPEELLKQRWVVLPQDSDLRRIFDRLLREQNLPSPNVVVETRSVGLVRTLIGQQGFVGWGPPSLYASSDPVSGIVALGQPAFRLRLPFHLYRLRRAVTSSTVRRALSILQRLCPASPLEGGSAGGDRSALGLPGGVERHFVTLVTHCP